MIDFVGMCLEQWARWVQRLEWTGSPDSTIGRLIRGEMGSGDFGSRLPRHGRLVDRLLAMHTHTVVTGLDERDQVLLVYRFVFRRNCCDTAKAMGVSYPTYWRRWADVHALLNKYLRTTEKLHYVDHPSCIGGKNPRGVRDGARFRIL